MIRTCKKCGFILGTRPNLLEVDGVCLSCINSENKASINYFERQQWLTDYIKSKKNNIKYDALVAVSGGKDSSSIVKRLIESHGIVNPLLVNVTDEFTHTKAGKYNLDNLALHFGLDTLVFRCNPQKFISETTKDFFEALNPLKWIESQIYEIPLKIASDLGISLVFFGENSKFEYGESTQLNIFHPASTDKISIIYMGAIYPYSISDALAQATLVGFKDLDYFNEWQRQGSIENFTQIDSIGYIIHLWCKFVKFGFQRVSDIACRMVREGTLSKEQAEALIRDRDYICDPTAKKDFCKTINITEKLFDETVDKFANLELVFKDPNGQWRRKDLYAK